MRLFVTTCCILLVLLFSAMFISNWFMLRIIREGKPFGSEFDPTEQIRIENPERGIIQTRSPIAYTSFLSKSSELTYEIRNNVLKHKGMHYQLKTGDIVVFDDSRGMLINSHKAFSTEDIGTIVTSINGRFP
jgi:hypothetical protein